MSMTLDLSSSSSPSSPPERVCYVHCNFCNTILAVSVPCSSMLGVVTVRCGHCANLLSVNMGALLHTVPLLQDHPLQKQQWMMSSSEEANRDYYHCSGSSPVNNKSPSLSFGGSSSEYDQPAPRTPPIRPPEKRQRIPSAYNRFIKEEIQRIKTSNPDMSHREAFSTAAKNWAHFPNIHFGQNQQTATDAGDRGTSTSTSQAANNNSLFF